MEGFIVQAFVDLFKGSITSWIKKGVATVKEQKEYNDFLNDVESWCNDFINKNETTVVATSAFFDYIKYYNLIDNLIEFIQQPRSQSEESFLTEQNEKAKEYLKDRRSLSPDDIRSVKEFIQGVFEKTRKYYEEKIAIDNTAVYYMVLQNNSLLKELSESLQVVNDVHIPRKATVIKKEYPYPQNTIKRKFALYKDIQDSFYFKLRSEDMLEVCLREKRIVLLGEAGCGKTIAIEQLAAMIGTTEYYPLRYNLNDYTNETIEQIITETYQEINYDKLFIIFDAYDEIEEKNRKDFARRINKFTSNNPNTIVLISSRNNFYKFANDNGEGGLFSSFKEYGISPITNADIESYIESNGICSKDFYDEIKKNKLYDLVTTPFYLKELIDIYLRCSALPPKADLMEEIIRNRFGEDCQKYATTMSIENYEYELFVGLEKLAFAIQCMRAVKISSTDYQRLIKDKTLRELIDYSGVFAKGNDGRWSFEHNNFREYLTAKYINRLDLTEITSLICTSDNKVFDSWLNVLSFLVLIRKDNDLLDYLIENDSQMIVRFERTRVDESIRNELVIKIVNDFAQKNVWISHSVNSSELIARFGQSREVCEYLIKQISDPINFRALYNALSVLSEFTELYGMEETIRSTLFNALKSDKVRFNEKYKVLDSLVSLNLQNDEITEYIINNYDKEMDPHYRVGVLKYLHNSGLYETYIDVFLEEYEQLEKQWEEKTSIHFEIFDVFVKVKETSALCKVVASLGKHRHPYSHDEEKQSIVLSNAAVAYNNGYKEVFDAVFDAIIEAEVYNHAYFRQSISFFEQTGTRLETFMKLIHSDIRLESYQAVFAIQQLADEKCYMYLLSKYEEDPKQYEIIVKDFASRFEENSMLNLKYKEALLKNGIVLPERRTIVDWKTSHHNGLQYYINCLFDKKKYCALIQKMLQSMGKTRITFSELDEIDYNPINRYDPSNSTEEHALQHLYYHIVALRKDENDDRDVYTTIESRSDWNFFIITECYNLLHRDEELQFSESQKSFFENYCRDQLTSIDFQKEIEDTENGTMSYTYRSAFFIFFSQFFDLKYEKEVYLNMLFVPSYLFKIKDNEHDKFPSYVVSKLPLAEIKERVKHNLSEETMCADALDMHIQFCKDHKLDWGVPSAIQLCRNESAKSWRKRRCVEYIEQVKGHVYLYNELLETEDPDVMESIIYITQKHKDSRLRERLEMLNQNSNDKRLYLNFLITLNSKYALKKYVELLKETMKASDMPKNSGLDSTIEAISTVQDISLLDDIDALREILFLPDFQDREEFGLYNGLYKAYENLARADGVLVRSHLETVLKKDNISEEEKTFCNSVILDIETINKQKSDVAWTIDEILAFWKHKEA